MKIISAAFGLANAFAKPEADFAVAIQANRIIATGARYDLRARYPQAAHEHFSNALMLPTFVNSHDHGRGLGTASLGIEDDVLENWLGSLATQPNIDPYLAAAYDGARLLRSGVTATAHSHNPRHWSAQLAESHATLRGYHDAGIRVAFHPVIVDQNRLIYAISKGEEAAYIAALPTIMQADAQALTESPLSHDEYFEMCEALFDKYHDAANHTAHIQVSPAGGQWCSDALIVRAADWAKAHHTRVQMHLLETHRQRGYALRKWGKGFVRHLDEIGVLGPWLTLAHMVWVESNDLALLAERGVAIAHNPSSNVRLRSGIAPLTQMVEAGITLGIGLDGHGLDDDQEYWRELRSAWSLANMRANTPTSSNPSSISLNANHILHMGTAGGAAATFGRTAGLGVLADDGLADLVILDLDFSVLDFVAQPDALAPACLHLATRQQVRHVLCNGTWVVRDGHCQGVDEAEIFREIRARVRAAYSLRLDPFVVKAPTS